MKVRIEIFEDDGTEKAKVNVHFDDENWKEDVTNFIYSIDGKKPPMTVPSSEIPTQQPAPQAIPPIQPAPPLQQQVPQNPNPQNIQLQPYNNQYPYPTMQQPFYHYTQQPVQYQIQPPTYPQVYHHPLQQAVFPTNQPPQQQQYAAQPVTTLQPQPQVQVQTQQVQQPNVQQPNVQQVQTQIRQPQVPLRDKINDTTLTISERLELFLKYEYPHVWFTSQEIQGHYERVYGFIKLSTVSTYLSRMYRKELLQRRGNRTQREYMYICDELDMPQTNPITTQVASGIMQ